MLSIGQHSPFYSSVKNAYAGHTRCPNNKKQRDYVIYAHLGFCGALNEDGPYRLKGDN